MKEKIMSSDKLLNKQQAMFIASIGHDLRSPLNGILGTNELLLLTKLSDEQTEYLNIQKRASEMMLNYVENLLNYIKIERGQFVIEKSIFDLKGTLESIIDTFIIQAKVNDTKLYLDFDSSIPKKLIGDKVKIVQIVSNVVGNAVKFTRQGQVVISVSMIKLTKKKAHLKIEIKDTGKGIESDKLEMIFMPFSQEEDAAKNYGGFGLGLYTTKTLVKKLKGEIFVESDTRRGTTFIINLSFEVLGETEDREDNLRTLIAHEDIPEKFYKLPFRVLCVDDSVDNHFLVKAFLKGTPLLVDFAADGNQALSYLKINNYDLIIMDIEMPNFDGVETIKMIRKNENLNKQKHVPAIAFSANTFKEQVESYFSAGFDNFISKPVRKASLITCIYQTLAYISDNR